MSRVDAVRLAVEKAREHGHSLDGAVLASDAFFPFPDGPQLALEAGVASLIQPGGSKRDDEVVEAVASCRRRDGLHRAPALPPLSRSVLSSTARTCRSCGRPSPARRWRTRTRTRRGRVRRTRASSWPSKTAMTNRRSRRAAGSCASPGSWLSPCGMLDRSDERGPRVFATTARRSCVSRFATMADVAAVSTSARSSPRVGRSRAPDESSGVGARLRRAATRRATDLPASLAAEGRWLACRNLAARSGSAPRCEVHAAPPRSIGARRIRPGEGERLQALGATGDRGALRHGSGRRMPTTCDPPDPEGNRFCVVD